MKNRQQIYNEVFTDYCTRYKGMSNRIPNYNILLSHDDNASRQANIKAVQETELEFQKQFKEKK